MPRLKKIRILEVATFPTHHLSGYFMINSRLSTMILLPLLALTGCSSEGPAPRPEGVQASGKVLLSSGKTLSGGTLVLRPDSGLYGATALIQSDGTFSLQETSGRQDIVPGKYQVFVSFPSSKDATLAKSVPERYQKSEDGDSDVYVEIKEGSQALEIRLK
jgi:hypothetical protein